MKIVNNNLSMKWYNFFYRIKLPISIAFSILGIAFAYNFERYLWDKISLIVWFTMLSILLFYSILLYKMSHKHKDTIFYFIVCLIIDTLLIISYNYQYGEESVLLFRLILSIVLWFLPNYIYIRKRKNIFE